MSIKIVDIGLLKPNPSNPRHIKDGKFTQLVKSIRNFPEMLNLRPIVVDADYVVLGGNMRLKACIEAGLVEVPIIIASELTKEQQSEFIIKDNVGFGEWDWNVLANEWEVEDLADWGLDLPLDFEEKEIDAVEDDYEQPDTIQTDIVLGDLFEIGQHRLLCGDSTDSDSVARLMDGQKADMVFTDPPYGMFLDTDYTKMPISPNGAKPLKHSSIKGDNEDFIPELINTIFACFNDCKEIFIWGADYFAELIPNKNNGSWIVWDKRVDENFDKMIGAAFELCWSKSKHQRKIARINNTLFSGEKDAQNKVHPTQKPIKLVTFFFDNWGKQKDLVADLYLGSGTTMVAAHQLKRKCYGMELDPKYCQVIIDRMLKLDPTLVIKRNGHPYESISQHT
jgi:site-specific DNA-methyltransferase (adenine-specific)